MNYIKPTARQYYESIFSRKRYIEITKVIQPTNLISFLPLNETTGTIINDYSPKGNNGVYSGVKLNETVFFNSEPVPYFDGSDYGNIYSNGLRNNFNGKELTVSLWIKPPYVDFWNNGQFNRPVNIQATNDRITFQKNSTANTYSIIYVANGITKQYNLTLTPKSSWLHWCLTVSHSLDEMKFYVNGNQVGTTLTNLGEWSELLSANNCVLGAANTTPLAGWIGYLSHFALWSTPLAQNEVKVLATAYREGSYQTPIGELLNDSI